MENKQPPWIQNAIYTSVILIYSVKKIFRSTGVPAFQTLHQSLCAILILILVLIPILIPKWIQNKILVSYCILHFTGSILFNVFNGFQILLNYLPSNGIHKGILTCIAHKLAILVYAPTSGPIWYSALGTLCRCLGPIKPNVA